jgi:hypothetical protein
LAQLTGVGQFIKIILAIRFCEITFEGKIYVGRNYKMPDYFAGRK